MYRLAAIDVGTNSIRLLVVAVEEPAHGYSVISDRKEIVRLGEQEYAHNRMTDKAMERAATVIGRFAETARGFDVREINAVATSAVREALNRQEFLDRVRAESGLDLQVISGMEEARLVYLGVSSGAALGRRKALFIDVGGGSTELIVGNQKKHFLLDSLKLGAIRITNRFLGDGSAPVSRKKYALLQEHIRSVAVQAARKALKSGFDLTTGSSGSLINLAEVSAAMQGNRPASMRNYRLPLKDLARVREALCRDGLEERRKLPGIKPERADILVAAAAIIETLMEMTGSEEIIVSEQGLREGLVVDSITRSSEARDYYRDVSPRERSVLQLARSCGYDEAHCRQVRMICLLLFDQMQALGLHRLNGRARELLSYASWLHDAGFFISHTNHHQHSAYIIRNSELLGFTDREQAVIASLALYHRKSPPKLKHPVFAALDPDARSQVEWMSAILRIAEALDRSHLSLVRHLALKLRPDGKTLELLLESDSDCQLELWGLEAQARVFRSVFGFRLAPKVSPPAPAEARELPLA